MSRLGLAWVRRLFGGSRPDPAPVQPGRDLLERAGKELEAGRPQAAVVVCRLALRAGADAAEAHELLGRAHLMDKRPDRAWPDLERAVELGRRSAPLFRARWDILHDQGKYPEALAEIARALELNPARGLYHYDRAVTLMWQGRRAEAVESAAAAIANGYDDHLVHSLRGACLRELGQLAESEAAYDAALAKDPKYTLARVGRARTRWALERFEEAETDLDAAEAAAPADPEGPFARGKLLYEAGDYPRAAECLERAVRLAPANKDYRLWQGAAYCQMGLYDLAADEVEAGIGLGPATAADYRWRGQARGHLKEYDAALADFDKAIELEPASDFAHGWRGWLLIELDRWADALRAYDEAVRLNPTSAHYRDQRSRVLDRLGREAEAAADFETCLDLELKANPPDAMNTPAADVYPLVRAHFADAPLEQLSLTERLFPARVSPDTQRALDRLADTPFAVDHFLCPKQNNNTVYNFQALYTRDRRNPITRAAPHHYEVDVGEDLPVRCLWNGVWLLTHRDARLAVLTTADQHHRRFQVAAPDTPAGAAATAAFLALVEAAVARGECYRGKVLSLDCDDDYDGTINGIKVHRLRPVRREDVILPRPTLDLLDRNVIQFVAARPRLRDLGLATKKGLLFHGPPGTGKTHTIHYLAAALPGTTTFLVSAEQVGSLAEYMTLARLYQPSLVVLEDVDLIARERRALRSGVEETLLNRLLNEMDGLKPDADIVFVLTTNAPAALEDALANRPGRVDQAIEFPYPDADGRARLVRMYAGRAEVSDALVERVVGRTQDTSPAFIKEVMRRSAQYAVVRGSATLSEPDADAALDEMLTTGLNARLFGFGGRPDPV
jgi:cell division protease FtsH